MSPPQSETLENATGHLAAFRQLRSTLRDILAEGSPADRQKKVCDAFMELTGGDGAALFLFDAAHDLFSCRAATGSMPGHLVGGTLTLGQVDPRTEVVVGLTAVNGQFMTVITVDGEHQFKDRFLLTIPVTASASTSVIGLLVSAHDRSIEIGDEGRIELIGFFTDLVTPIVELGLQVEQLERKTESLRVLHDIGHELSSIRKVDALLEKILTLIERHLKVDRCSIMILDAERRVLKVKKALGMEDTDIGRIRVPVGEGIAGHVAATAKPLLIKDIKEESWATSRTARGAFTTNSLLSVPLIADEAVIGVVNVNNKKDRLPFTEEDLDLLVTISSEIAMVLQRSYMEWQLKRIKELDRDIDRSMV